MNERGEPRDEAGWRPTKKGGRPMNESAFTRRDVLRMGGGALVGIWGLGLTGCAGQSASSGSEGSEWKPERNVMMVVPADAGGGSDVFGRACAAGIEKVSKGTNVTVENRPGGSSVIGYSYVTEQQGDPHFLLAAETTFVAQPLTMETPYSWEELTPIGQLAEDATLLVVAKDSPYRSLADVVEAARQSRLTAGVVAKTGLDAIVLSLVGEDQDVTFEQVVFDSGGAIVTALLGDNIDLASLNPGEVIGQLESGDMRALVAFAKKRYQTDLLADVPTAREEGVDVTFTQFRGIFAPGGIRPEEARYWEKTLPTWSETDGYASYISDNYLIAQVRIGQEFKDYLQQYEETLRGVIGESGG